MDYVCLAAGKGTRFGRLGDYLQKCMYPMGLRPFLEFSIRNLLHSRYFDPTQDKLILVVGHHAEQIRNYFGEVYEGLELEYLPQPQALGTGHALHLVWEVYKPSQPVIVWLADLYVPPSLFERIFNHPEANVQTLAAGPEDESPKVRVTTKGKRVTRAWCGEGDYDIGLWKLSPEVLQGMTMRTENEVRVLPNLQRAIEAGARVGFVRADEWLHLGGTKPSPEANVREVVARVLELEDPA